MKFYHKCINIHVLLLAGFSLQGKKILYILKTLISYFKYFSYKCIYSLTNDLMFIYFHYVVSGSCTSGAVRLMANSANYGRSTGRVEVCHNSQWGTVCRNPSWDTNNTDVVCQQLGYQGDNSYTYTFIPGSIGSTTNPIKFRNVNCVGNENSLFDCSKSISSFGCSHSSDVAVRCSGKSIQINSFLN